MTTAVGDDDMVDHSISIEQRVGSKWVRVVWPQLANEPDVQWRLEMNGSPGPSMTVDVQAGSRRVRVEWPSGAFDAKIAYWDYQAQEYNAQSPATKAWYKDEEADWNGWQAHP